MSSAFHIIGCTDRIGWRATRRVRRLTKYRTRRRLAAGLERALADAQAPNPAPGSALPVQRDSVIACRPELIELIERLRAARPVYAQGVELAAELLRNSDSPLYQPGGGLRAATDAALGALDGHLD
jgi:hypothetical protein